MIKKIFFVLMVVFISPIVVASYSNEASALKLNKDEEIYKKIIRSDIRYCYMNQPLYKEVHPMCWPDNEKNEDLGICVNNEFYELFDDDTLVAMPTGYTKLKEENEVSCKGLFYGDKLGSGEAGEYDGILNIYGKNVDDKSSLSEKEQLAVGLGYETNGSPDNPYIDLYFTWHYSYTKEISQYALCGDDNWHAQYCDDTDGPYPAAAYVTGSKVNGDGTVASALSIFSSGQGIDIDKVAIKYDEKDKNGGTLSINCANFSSDQERTWALVVGGQYDRQEGLDCTEDSLEVSYNKTLWNDGNAATGDKATEASIVGFIRTHLPVEFSIFHHEGWSGTDQYINTTLKYTAEGTISNDPDYINSAGNLTLPGGYSRIEDWTKRAEKATEYFTGGTDTGFSEEDTYGLYIGYLTDYYKTEFHCGASQAEFYQGRDGYIKASNILYDHVLQDECYVKATENEDKKVNGVNGVCSDQSDGQSDCTSFWQPAGEKKTFEDLLKTIADLNITAESVAEYNIDPATNNTSGNNNNNQADVTCQSAGGASSLGWIVCSILDWMQEATNGLYNSIVKPALNVQPELFTTGGDVEGAQKAWGIFRDFANIAFVILVLFVIFSQVTGVGIDNYGIKKILPKLIIAAALINLSYLICLICVDLSNIVGDGIQGLLNGIRVTDDFAIYGGAQTTNVGADYGIVAVGIVATAVGVVAIYKNPALLLTLFITVLGVFIAVLFVFILLAGRKAAIVLLTVVSPVAFILYMLPNTKKIYDKWFNLWKAMLLVYPICGLLIGGGNFASKLMLIVGNTSDAGATFTAMVVGIVPIFFIPTVIKSAYAAIGSVGGIIAGFGGRLRGGFDRGARNSQAYQNAQKRSQARNQRISAQRRAGVRLDKDGNVVESRRPTARLRRSLANTGIGNRLGLAASIGQGASEFASLESARRGNVANMDIDAMRATFAGINDKETAQRIANQGTLMAAGKVKLADGTTLNANSQEHLQRYHEQQLAEAAKAIGSGNTTAYNNAMDKVKAVQDLMAKSDTGRANIRSNYESAINGGQTGGLTEAASHLMGAHGSDIKAINRGMHSLMQNLATASFNAEGSTDLDRIRSDIANHTYEKAGLGKYTAQTLPNVDESELARLRDSVSTMMDNERNQLNTMIEEARNNNNIHVNETVNKLFSDIQAEINRSNPGNYEHGAGI